MIIGADGNPVLVSLARDDHVVIYSYSVLGSNVTIAVAGGIPALVSLVRVGSISMMGALTNLAMNDDNKMVVIAAGF